MTDGTTEDDITLRINRGTFVVYDDSDGHHLGIVKSVNEDRQYVDIAGIPGVLPADRIRGVAVMDIAGGFEFVLDGDNPSGTLSDQLTQETDPFGEGGVDGE